MLCETWQMHMYETQNILTTIIRLHMPVVGRARDISFQMFTKGLIKGLINEIVCKWHTITSMVVSIPLNNCIWHIFAKPFHNRNNWFIIYQRTRQAVKIKHESKRDRCLLENALDSAIWQLWIYYHRPCFHTITIQYSHQWGWWGVFLYLHNLQRFGIDVFIFNQWCDALLVCNYISQLLYPINQCNIRLIIPRWPMH